MELIEITSIASAGGYGGFGFIGPLGNKPIKRKLYKMKESPDYLYNENGDKLKLNDLSTSLNEDDVLGNKNKVGVEPKCESFPYCTKMEENQTLKLIGTDKDSMCENCYDFCDTIGKKTKNTAETIAEIIRKKYTK